MVFTEKFGGGVSCMVWGAITSKGVGKLVFVDSSVNKEVYKNIFDNNLFDSAKINGLDTFIFQQDGAPAHTSKLIREYLAKNNIDVLEWTAQSPDLNPIEHIWAYIKRILGNERFSSIENFKAKISEIWYKIPSELCRKLVLSMPDRINAVIEAKGAQTRF